MDPTRLTEPTDGAEQGSDVVLKSLRPELEKVLWRGSELGRTEHRTVSTGFAPLDQELPGGGWPCGAVTEILQPHPALAEWRLLAPALRALSLAKRPLWLVGAPMIPFCPGLRDAGIDENQLIRVDAQAPAQRLWATEQAVKATGLGAVLAWLPQVRSEQIRRLQSCAAAADMPVFLMRAVTAHQDSSAAPLRVEVRLEDAWTLQVRILKRRGPSHDGALSLPSIPQRLAPIVAHRFHRPTKVSEWKPTLRVGAAPASISAPGLGAEGVNADHARCEQHVG
ncbi:translesion DNA synthesis-associated protein ImuA [Caldimonas brevitalea]|uniref:RecA/RadA recombinase n=1 Tax=Caldimonas brevitalea TaxID=413882 RepID=A0A0G3BQQ2_9BURK|nr:translesion DNA synthesis-associated protein ImuA [Caldimonas brevitalea]AKJ28860.1 RecA/RadA recombinase [Caldimonas brevitalea]